MNRNLPIKELLTKSENHLKEAEERLLSKDQEYHLKFSTAYSNLAIAKMMRANQSLPNY